MLTVRDLAHARAGDKGHSVNVSVTPTTRRVTSGSSAS